MKRFALTIILLLALLTNASGEEVDSLVMGRMYRFQQNFSLGVKGFTTNVYMKHLYQIHKRNATLWAIPSMYKLSYGKREFVSEEYSRFTFNDVDDYENHQQVYYTTIPRNRHAMPILIEYLTPNFYDVTIYGDHILSPFCEENHVYYRYKTVPLSNHQIRLYFRPRVVRNTQLVRGRAILDERTGRIEQVEMEGEFDMIRFQTLTMMGEEGAHALLPKISQTNISFKFGGNHVTSQFEAIFDCPITLPDSVNVEGDRFLIDSIRPVSLSKDELRVYEEFDRQNGFIEDEEEIAAIDTLEAKLAWVKEDEQPDTLQRRHHNYLKEIGWDLIGDNLLHSLRAESEKGYVKLSPIIDPQYISYSRSKGFSYKFKLGASYRFNDNTVVYFNPQVGYNFKLHEAYYNAPLNYIYNSDLDASLLFETGKDNRIGNSAVLDEIREEYGDLPELENKDLDLYDDYYARLIHHIRPINWMSIETGMVFHKRKAVNATVMASFGKLTKYYSFAPSISLKLQPWSKAPLFTIDYERGLKMRHNYINYERWELDASIKHRMRRTQLLNARLGGGLYTAKSNDYFMDFANFRDNNLPDGWEDDWTGDFQLLDSRLYNESQYYIRGNLSFETPLLCGYLVPIVGRYVERERIYLSSLSIAHTRLYSELGYSFTCRFFSMGVFASFMNTEYQDLGAKFTFELFRRW